MKSNQQNSGSAFIFWAKWTVPIVLIVLIQVAQLFPAWIEKNYSTEWYGHISFALRNITGWAPFSIGDIGYVLFGCWLLISIIRRIIQLVKGQYGWKQLGNSILKILHGILWIYIWFTVLWGLNYSRQGIASQLQLHPEEYCKEDVKALTEQLINTVNELRRQIKDSTLPARSLTSIFVEANNSYERAEKDYPFLAHPTASIKPSLYSPLGSYFGFTGYYNPFSGEAQVRSDIPRILIPYIACHEMAHQIGYASESEANFVGYLTASASADVYFRYSVYLDMFSYAQSEEIKWYLIDRDISGIKTVIKENRTHLDSLVRKDRKEIREFFYKRSNKVSPLVSNVYDQYLKMNKQFAGINSYNEVIGWLIAYQKKYGKL
jgi:hypothetical protein